MAYKLKQKWLPASKYSLKAPYSMKPEYITIHNTANDASAENEIAYMIRNNNATSFHVAIDDVDAIEAISFSRNAWHAGDGANGTGNRKSIGIEICYSKSGGSRYKEAEANTIEYVAHALVQLGLKPDRVRYHKEWSGKHCPHRIIDEKREKSFKEAIAKRYEELKNPKPEAKPEIKPEASKPVSPSKPAKKDDVYRVIIDGKQVGAYADDRTTVELVKQAVIENKKDIRLERV